jgi:AbrB family looped-hinge helix DNA binding protein
MWYVSTMMGEPATYRVHLGERGRIVLPAELRRRAGLREGDDLVLIYSDGVIRLASRRELAAAGRGAFRSVGKGRDLVGELLKERREEAAADASK